MSSNEPRVAVLIADDLVRNQVVRTKNQLFYEALTRRFQVIEFFSAGLTGWRRLLNVLQVAYPDRRYWSQRRYMNVPAFQACSYRAAKYLEKMRGRIDVILQDNVLFDGLSGTSNVPSVLYTDYTAALSARQPAAGRSPFSTREREQWLKLEGMAMQRATHICTWSRRVRDSVVIDYQIPDSRVSAIGGGLNLDPLPEIRKRFPDHDPVILFIGSDFYRKGGDLVLNAFAMTRIRIPNARLLFLTSKPIPKEYPLDGVEVIASAWEREAVTSLYKRADVFVLPSRLETWGDVIIEAMSYGLPCIGVAGQPMEEIIEHEHTGLIVQPEDSRALSEAMNFLLGDLTLCQVWGLAGREKIEKQFTWDHVVERLAVQLIAAA